MIVKRGYNWKQQVGMKFKNTAIDATEKSEQLKYIEDEQIKTMS